MVDLNESVAIVQENVESFILTKAAYSSVVISLIIFFLGLIIGKILGKLVHKLLHEFELNKLVKSFFGMNVRIEEMTGNIVSFVTYCIFIFWSLDRLGNTQIMFRILVIIVIFTSIIALLLGFKDAVPNFLAGITFYFNKKKLEIGDRIKVGNVSGKVQAIDFIETLIITKDKDLIYIPNAYLIKHMVIVKKTKK